MGSSIIRVAAVRCAVSSWSLGVALLASPACAQSAPPATDAGPASAAQAPAVAAPDIATPAPAPIAGDIVVTGTRIRSGFSAPTPVSTASAEQLHTAAPTNVADALNQLPVFNGSTKTSQGTNTNSGGTTGQNLLNLRGLGANRTLVLLDGRRMPTTNASGSVDVNILPQELIQRVDVVTGGASAAYGSDAVSGVVNFVLDTKFTGLKLEAQTGVSTHADMPLGGGSLAWGHDFADGRGHVIAGLQYFHQDGVGIDQPTGRDWFDNNSARVTNPVKGGVGYIVIPNARSSIGTFGGLITSGPLKGMQFLNGGVLAPFNYGTQTGSAFQSGGDGAKSQVALAPSQTRYNAFVHGEYQLSDTVTLFAEGLYARTHTTEASNYLQNVGSALQYTVYRDNAYLPASVAAMMDANKITSFTLGRFEGDLPLSVLDSRIDAYHGLVGAKGTLATKWNWDVSYNYGRSDQFLAQNNLTRNRALYASADAVVNPANGQIVCRSTLSGLDAGCVPRDILGPGQDTDALNNYIIGNSWADLTLQEHVASANISGDLGPRFALAAPISVAAGVEYRKELGTQSVDATSAGISDGTGIRGFPSTLQGKVGAWRTYNPQPFNGAYDIKEGYLELGVPLVRNAPFARSIDLNGAVRHAIYSQSGGVTTWKLGGVWDVNGAVRLRGTLSQDIRGPNLLELFNPGSQTLNNLTYLGKSAQSQNIESGNPNLVPEVARTFTGGAVLKPDFIPGLQMSIDYYRIHIKDAIGMLTEQQVLDQCAAGNTTLCQMFTITSAGTLVVRNKTLNLSVVRVGGIDMEVAYRHQIGAGQLSLRLLANHGLTNQTQAPGSPSVQLLGSTTTPKWSGVFQATYSADRFSLFAQERMIGKAKLDPNLVDGVDIIYADNTTPAVFYTDLTLTYNLKTGGHKTQFYTTINNLFDRDPPRSPPQVTSFSMAASSAYDQIGRYITMGARVSF